jgi:hypothetical protein
MKNFEILDFIKARKERGNPDFLTARQAKQ